MILGLELTLFIYGLLAAVFCVTRSRSHTLGLLVVLAANIALVYLINPLLLMYLAAQIAWIAILYLLISKKIMLHSLNWSWLAFVGLLPPNLYNLFNQSILFSEFLDLQRLTMSNIGWQIGANFFVIRSFIVLREALSPGDFKWIQGFTSLTFLPAFPAGPICGGTPWAKDKIESMQVKNVISNLMRFGWGAAALYVLAPRLRLLADFLSTLTYGKPAEIYLDFIALYLDFSGYSAMALAVSALYGVRLPENFNRPYLATSIREFWRRWHISLSLFVSDYLLKPMVRRFGSRWAGVTTAFLFTGLWHEFSWQYIAWGLAHGLAMSASLREWPSLAKLSSFFPTKVIQTTSWFTTVSFVAIISHWVQSA